MKYRKARTAEQYREALGKVLQSQSWSNFPAVIEGFTARGIPAEEVKPKENVFTFDAWRALGRTVRRGERGVKVATFRTIERAGRDEATGEEKPETYRMPWFST